MPIIPGILASARRAGTNFDSIATSTVGAGGTSSISFSSIPSTYSHLQIRFFWYGSSVGDNNIALRCNGDTGANYTLHQVIGTGAAASATGATGIAFARIGYFNNSSSTNGYIGIVDILDYTSTNKQKTIRSLNGFDNNGNGVVGLNSSVWLPGTIAAVNSLTILSGNSVTIPQYSHFALYGIKA